MDYRAHPRIDWFRIFADLKAVGISIDQINADLKIPRSTLLGWKNIGAEPKFRDGELFLNYWQQKTGNDFDHVPMVGVIKIRKIVRNPTMA